MHFGQRKLMALLCIVVVSTVTIVFATETFRNKALPISTMTETGEIGADKVTIYGNGFTFVTYEETIHLENSLLQFYLPSGTLTDTLIISGISVVKITTSEEYNPVIERGDIITVYTEEGVYTGKFLCWDSMLLLEANNGTLMIPGNRITKIVLTEVVKPQGPKIFVEVTTDSQPGDYQLRISYLMRGPRWEPTYFIDVEISYLECWATIRNVENWSNFTLVLVSGGPHVVYRGPIVEPNVYAESLRLQSTPSIDFTSTTNDEYHEYMYGKRLSFEEGTVVRLPLFNGTVSLRQEYFWEGGEVQNRYHINNTLSEPFAAGIAEFYRGEKWIGEDSIPYTPVNGKTIAIVNYAYDIKVTSQVIKSIDESYHRVQGINITIRNHKTVSIQILIQQYINGYYLVVSTPPATRVGPILSWVINVDASGTATIYYEWESRW